MSNVCNTRRYIAVSKRDRYILLFIGYLLESIFVLGLWHMRLGSLFLSLLPVSPQCYLATICLSIIGIPTMVAIRVEPPIILSVLRKGC